jgi:RNA polymerase sigma-B factor
VIGSALSYARSPDVPRELRRLRTGEVFGELSAATDPETQARLRDQIVLLNVGVARTVARRYHRRGLEDDDVDQTAYMALVSAVQRFDHGRGHDFLTYAVPTIRGEIKRHFRDHGWTIRVPRSIQETQREIRRADPDVDGRDRCSNARLDDLAALVGRPRREVSDALKAQGCFTPISLDLELGSGDRTTLGDSIAADDDWVSVVEARSMTQLLVRRLGARDQRVVYLRYVHEWTQKAIAEELGVTQMQVSRILTRIHQHLRAELPQTELPEARTAS